MKAAQKTNTKFNIFPSRFCRHCALSLFYIIISILPLYLVMRRRSRWLGEPRRRRTDGLRDGEELQLPEPRLCWLYWLLLRDLQWKQTITLTTSNDFRDDSIRTTPLIQDDRSLGTVKLQDTSPTTYPRCVSHFKNIFLSVLKVIAKCSKMTGTNRKIRFKMAICQNSLINIDTVVNVKKAMDRIPRRLFPDIWSIPWHFRDNCQIPRYFHVFSRSWHPNK